MENIVLAVIITAIVAVALAYIIRAKKKGQKCIGCPDSKTCPHAKNGGCSMNFK